LFRSIFSSNKASSLYHLTGPPLEALEFFVVADHPMQMKLLRKMALAYWKVQMILQWFWLQQQEVPVWLDSLNLYCKYLKPGYR
jgi:hypothetical protein